MTTEDQTIERFVDSVRTLPPAPKILTDLLVILNDANHDTSRIVELVQFDPALTARVLRLCNSAALGGSGRVEDLHTAILRLGFNLVFQLVASVVSGQTLGDAQRGYGMGRGELWRHAVATAMASKALARTLGSNESLAFTAALLHDLGKLVISVALEGSYDHVLREMDESGRSFLEAEKAVLGVDHAEVGAHLLVRWNFPENLVSAVRYHHHPRKAAPHEALAACVHLGDVVSHLLGHGYGHHAYAVRPRPEALTMLGFGPNDIDLLVLATQNDIAASPILANERSS